MATKIIKESQLRQIFKGKQISEDAIEWLDEWVEGILDSAYGKVKDNNNVKRISKEIAQFIVNPNAIVVINGDHGDDEE